MKLKGRTILVLCLLLFGGFAVFDFYSDKSKAEKAMEETRLMTVNFEQVNEVQLQKNGDKVVLKRDVDGWKMEEPLKDLADNEAIDELVKSAFTEKIMDVVKEGKNIDWKLYGLDAPLGKITFRTSDNRQNEYQISSLKNFEDNVYVRRDGENRVLLVNSLWQSRAGKTVAELRDRRFLRHKIASVDELKLRNSKGLIHLQRKEGTWAVRGKAGFKLDQNKVRSLLNSIAEAKAAEILETPKNLPPRDSLFTLDLMMDGKSWSATVGQAKDKKIFAQVSDPDFFMKMEPGALDNLIAMKAEDLKETPEPQEASQEKEQ